MPSKNGKSPNGKADKPGKRGNRRTNKRTTVTPDGSLLRYLALGEGRALRRLRDILVAEQETVSLSTLERWSKRDGWVETGQTFDEDRVKVLEGSLMLEAQDAELRWARAGRVAQSLGIDAMALMVPGQGGQSLQSPQDIVRFIDLGIKWERDAIGKGQAEAVQVYNTLIIPVLTLFQTVVADLPQAMKDEITKAFATGVNEVREKFIPEGE